MFQNNQTKGFSSCFFCVAVLELFGHPQMVLKGQEVGAMYGPMTMSKHKNKPLTKSLGSFFQKK
jgi:hypothetical protein